MNNILNIYIQSFSYKQGTPVAVDENGGGFVFDCRSIPNPGREEQYKLLTGKSKEVANYIDGLNQAKAFWQNSLALVELSVSTYLSRGFTSLSVNYGCTGGQHRSVYMAEKLAEHFSNNSNIKVHLSHRELDKK